MKVRLLSIAGALGACTAYPPPAAHPVAADARQAQAAADARCALSGRIAIMVRPAECTSEQCVTRFECR